MCPKIVFFGEPAFF